MKQENENEFGNITNKNQKVIASVLTYQASYQHQRIIQCKNADLCHIRSAVLNISNNVSLVCTCKTTNQACLQYSHNVLYQRKSQKKYSVNIHYLVTLDGNS